MKLLFIDNFDSFTYNLADEFEKRGHDVFVYRNNMTLDFLKKEIAKMNPSLIVIPPGPSSPKEAGVCIPIIQEYAGKIPLFGVCLGHQCMTEAFGGVVGRAPFIVHGKTSSVEHDGKTIFKNIPSPISVARYHSLAALKVPKEFEVSAKTDDGIVMGMRHKKYFVEGIQFHPESVLTPVGGLIIENVLRMLRIQ